ncbi:MAG: succinylglutamate desuccinylase/aspartoacylase family protein [Bacteroidota bacterium]
MSNTRLINKFESAERGPLIIFIGALHGNELTGAKAIYRVFEAIEQNDIPFKGKIIGLLGNTAAIHAERRFLDYDMNRCWTEENIQGLTNRSNGDLGVEDKEVLDLLNLIEEESEGDYTEKILVDLHATSSDKGNFVIIPQDESTVHMVKVLKLPIVLDLDKYLKGTLLKFMHDRGFISFAFEGGLIGSQKAVELHTSGIWELLFASGNIERQHGGEFSRHDQIIEDMITDYPHLVKVKYMHWVERTDRFKMKPGYYNFQPISKGELLASDRNGNIESPCDGLIFMPLYQNSGNEGFFVVEEANTP